MPELLSPPTTGANPTKRAQILQLAKEIEQLAAGSLPPQQFFPQFLARLVSALGAQGGAVWLSDAGRLNLCCEQRLSDTSFADNADVKTQHFHQRLLGEVVASGQTRTIHTDDETQFTLPVRHLLVLAPLHADQQNVGVIEVFQRPDVSVESRAGFLQFVEQMCGYASRYLEQARRPAPPAATAGTFSEELARFGLQLQRSLRVNEVASVAANDGRLLVGCDRVSVLVRRGRKIRVEAVSGQETIQPRANLIRAMVALSEQVIMSGERVRYLGMWEALPPQVEKRLADFVQESGSRMVLAVPLREPAPLWTPQSATEQSDPRPRKPGRVMGCLVLEQFSHSEPRPELTERLDWLTAYTAAALHNARVYRSVFLLPLWRALGRTADWLHGRRLAKTLATLILIAAVVSALVFVQFDFRVEGEGRLMPVHRREVFVPNDGEVVEVLVSSGERVSEGQLLVRLRNNELRASLVATRSQLEEKRKLLAGLTAERDDAIKSPSGEREIRVEGELAKTRAEIHGLEQQLLVFEEREQQLQVRAPIAGVVSTFEVDQLLRHRPVRRGEILLDVMDDAGPWQLELDVAEHRMGHLLRAQDSLGNDRPVEFLLVTAPEQTHRATLRAVSTRAVVSDSQRPVVEVLAALEDDQEVNRRIGAEVRAKIHCGRSCLGYVLFGDVIEFVQKYFWL